MSKTISSCVLWACVVVALAPVDARAADEQAPGSRVDRAEQWQVGSAPSFSSGKYGTDTRVDVLQTPFTARRLFDRGDVTAVFAMTCIWGTGNVTLVNGTPVRSERLAYLTTTTRTTATVTTSSVTTRTCGMGDIVVRGRFYVVD